LLLATCRGGPARGPPATATVEMQSDGELARVVTP
jgi:hypothetical protein